MAHEDATEPVEDSIPKIDGQLAVGTDMEFQKRWWRFENALWSVFLLIVIAALLGSFGRGFVAKASATAKDGSLTVHYDRIVRYGAPSRILVRFTPSAVHDGTADLWAGSSLLRTLGLTRISPQPAHTMLGRKGQMCTFSATSGGGEAEFSIRPLSPGITHIELQVPGFQKIGATVVVVP